MGGSGVPDIVVSADARNAIRAFVELNVAINNTGASVETLRRKFAAAGPMFDKTIGDVNKAAAARVQMEAFSRAVANQADALKKSIPAYQERNRAIDEFIVKLKRQAEANSAGWSPKQLQQYTAQLEILRARMRAIQADPKMAGAQLHNLMTGRMMAQGEVPYAQLLSIMQRLASLEQQRLATATRMAAVRAEEAKAQASYLAAANMMQSNKTTLGNTVMGAMSNPARTAAEIAQLSRAQEALQKVASKHKLTYADMIAVEKAWLAQSVAGLNQYQRKAYEAYNAVMVAARRVGSTRAAEEARATRETQRQMRAMATSYDSAHGPLKGMLLSWRSLIRLVSIQTLHLGFGRFISSIFEATRSLTALQLKISQIRTITLSAQMAFDTWQQAIYNLSATSGKTATDVAEAVYFTISNQVAHGKAALDFANQAAVFSRVAATTVEDAVNLGSSVFKAYNLSLEDTEAIFAKTMGVIELGRVVGSEMANTLGRVAPLASSLGISFSELGGVLASMTSRGIKVNEVYTLISNVLLKLMRPTAEMKKIFDEFGVSSGTAFIQTYGWPGVMAKLEEHFLNSADAVNELGEAFNRVRAIRGGQMLFADPVQRAEIERFTNQIRNAEGRYGIQQEHAVESEAFRVQQALASLQNHFQKTFGEPILKFFADLQSQSGGVVGVFNKLVASFAPITNVFKSMGGFIGKFNLSLQGTITYLTSAWLVSRLFNYTVGRDDKGQVFVRYRALGLELGNINKQFDWAIVKSQLLASSMTIGLSAVIGVVVGVIARLSQLRAEQEMNRKTAQDNMRQFTELMRDAEDETKNMLQNGWATRKEQLQAALREQAQVYLQHVSEVQRALSKIKTFQEETSSTVARTMGTAFGNFESAAKDAASAAERVLKDLISEIKSIEKDLLQLADSAQQAAMELLYREAEDEGDIDAMRQILQQRLDTSTGFLLAASTKADIDHFAKEAEKTLEKLHSLLLIEGDETDDIKSQLQDIYTMREGALRRIIEHNKEEKKTLEASTKKHQELLDNAKDRVNELTKIKNLEGLSPEQVVRRREDFEAKSAEVRGVLEALTSGVSGDKNVPQDIRDKVAELQKKMLEAIDSTTKTFEDRLRAIKATEDLANIQKKIKEAHDSQLDLQNQAMNAEKKARDASVNLTKNVMQGLQGVESLFALQATDIYGTVQPQFDTTSTRMVAKTAEDLAKFTALASRLAAIGVDLDLRTRGQQVLANALPSGWQQTPPKQGSPIPYLNAPAGGQFVDVNFANILRRMVDLEAERAKAKDDPVKTANILSQMNLLAEALREIAGGKEAFALLNPLSAAKYGYGGKYTGVEVKNATQSQPVALTDWMAALAVHTQKTVDSANESQRLMAENNAALEQIKALRADLPNNEELILTMQWLTEAEIRSTTSAESMLSTVESLIQRFDEVLAQGLSIGTGHAMGGRIGGGPTDTVPAWLTPGEFVVNAKATAKALPLLEAINRGDFLPAFTRAASSVRGFAGGGVVTNVGDVNVTVNGGSTARQTIEEIGRGLRRGLRRGTISLS